MGNKSLILVCNAGSSSLKFKLFESDSNLNLLAQGNCAEVGTHSPRFTCRVFSNGRLVDQVDREDSALTSHEASFEHVIDHLTNPDKEPATLSDRTDIRIVGHRVVHGGGKFNEPTLITADTLSQLDDLGELAPLHNHRSVVVMRKCLQVLPESQNFALFDTMFHTTIPEYIYTYPLPRKVIKEKNIRKYGFHGLSHNYVAKKAAQFLGAGVENFKFITLHLGAGSSACAIKRGKSLDTSMGLTPLAGLPGGTRSGDIDPTAVFHFLPNPSSPTDSHLTEAERVLNHDSGLLGICGTADFHEIVKRMRSDSGSDSESARLAFEIFANRVQNFVGAYLVALKGADAVVFAGGLGENSPELRAAVCDKLKWVGAAVDKEKNEKATETMEKQGVADVGAEGNHIRVLVVTTDEEREIAEEITRKKV